MDEIKKTGESADPQAAAERFAEPQARGSYGFGGHEIWHEIVGTERDREPGARFLHVADRLIADPALRERVGLALKEVLGRCVRDGDAHAYRFARVEELDDAFFAERIREALAPGAAEVHVTSFRTLLPRPRWMSENVWGRLWGAYVREATGSPDGIGACREARDRIFGAADTRAWMAYDRFALPARCAFGGGLVHQPLMGELAGLLAAAASYAAVDDVPAATRACRFVIEAAKAPPFIAVGGSIRARADIPIRLIHVRAD